MQFACGQAQNKMLTNPVTHVSFRQLHRVLEKLFVLFVKPVRPALLDRNILKPPLHNEKATF